MSENLKFYFEEVLDLIIERAMKAKEANIEAKKTSNLEQKLFQEGRLIGYYEVLSYLIGQAEFFGLTPKDFPKLNFDPEKELL